MTWSGACRTSTPCSCLKADKRSNLVKVLKHSTKSSDDLLQYYKSMIRPVIEYACQVWQSNLIQDQRNRLEAIQKRALQWTINFSATSILHRHRQLQTRFAVASVLQQDQPTEWLCLHRLLPFERRTETVVKLRHSDKLPGVRYMQNCAFLETIHLVLSKQLSDTIMTLYLSLKNRVVSEEFWSALVSFVCRLFLYNFEAAMGCLCVRARPVTQHEMKSPVRSTFSGRLHWRLASFCVKTSATAAHPKAMYESPKICKNHLVNHLGLPSKSVKETPK
jgi:hypothetical protein